MRVLFAVAAIVLGTAGASAADLNTGRGYSAIGYRSAPLVIYDNQPGVTMRAYWQAPWGHRHYFPATGKRPRIGRHENLAAVSRPSKPAQTFRRSWSNAWAFAHELPRIRALPRDTQPAPQAKRLPQNSDAVKP